MEGKEKREQHTGVGGVGGVGEKGGQQFCMTGSISHISFNTKEGHPIKPDANEAMK